MKNNQLKLISIFLLLTIVLAKSVIISKSNAVDSFSSKLVYEWQNPIPQGNMLNSVWGSSSHDVFAVGNYGTILHFDGNNWVTMKSGVVDNLKDIWGVSRNEVFAVGQNGTILKYDGSSWTNMDSGSIDLLRGIWGTSGSDIFVAGGYDKSGFILHYDGNMWSMMKRFNSSINDLWGFSSNDIFAVGNEGTILHYNGITWSEMQSGTTESLNDIWGSKSTNVFTHYSVLNSDKDLNTILHYDGISWKTIDNKIEDIIILGLWGNSDSDIFAVGSNLLTDTGSILHYDGVNWEVMTTISFHSYFKKVWGDNKNVFTVGNGGIIYHYNGNSWTNMSYGTQNWLYSIWGSSSTDIFAVGGRGTIIHSNGNNNWSEMDSTTNNWLRSVWGLDKNNVFAVGDKGTIIHYDGNNWSEMESNSINNYNCVWGIDKNHIFAAGEEQISRYDGNQWIDMADNWTNMYTNTIDVSYHLKSLSGTNKKNIFTVGSYSVIYNDNSIESGPLILHYDGSVWTKMETEFNDIDCNYLTLDSVWGVENNNIYAAGSCGIILNYNGIRWKIMNTDNITFENIYCIWGMNNNNVFAVGDGVVLYFNGISWSSITSGTSNHIFSAWGDNDTLFSVGSNGLVIKYYTPQEKEISIKLPEELTEGDGVQVNAGNILLQSDPLQSQTVVFLNSNDESEVLVPKTVTIPAGGNSASFDINVVDDNTIDGTQTITISATANGYMTTSSIKIGDNDHNDGDGNQTQENDGNTDESSGGGCFIASINWKRVTH